LENIYITGLQIKIYLLRRRGSAELVEKVGMSNTGDSTISHKGVRCFWKDKLKDPKEEEEEEEGTLRIESN
jgi:hypothetical protein